MARKAVGNLGKRFIVADGLVAVLRTAAGEQDHSRKWTVALRQREGASQLHATASINHHLSLFIGLGSLSHLHHTVKRER